MKKESLIRDGISRKDRRGKTRGGKKRNGCDGHRCRFRAFIKTVDISFIFFGCRETGTRGCSPREGGNYRCKCKRGFAGRYCERGEHKLLIFFKFFLGAGEYITTAVFLQCL